MGEANIITILQRADKVDVREGLIAYRRYNEIMRRISHYYGYPLRSVTAAFCALSPNNDYAGNLRSLVTCLAGHKQAIEADRIVVSTYNACKLRALTYLDGVDFLEKTKGPKTRAFYLNIITPLDPYPVTIDGHMVGVPYADRFTMKEAIQKKFNYRLIADGFRNVASRMGLITNQLQGILWFTQKRIYRVVYEPNYNLLNLSDHWRLIRYPEQIKPYRFLTQVRQTKIKAAAGRQADLFTGAEHG